MAALIADDPAGWAQVIVEVIAIGLVVAFYFLDYRRGKEKAEERKRNLKKAILSALKRELEMNWRYLSNPPTPEVYHPEYYDPTRQIFKVYRDDAIAVALSNVESDVLLSSSLSQSLLAVSQAVRFVNQQIDELMAFRFGEPSQLARAGHIVENTPNALVSFASDNSTIPQHRRHWFKELARRHWAIVNEGYWYRLLPRLIAAQPHVDEALEEVGLKPLEMPKLEIFLEDLASRAEQALTTSGSPLFGFEEQMLSRYADFD